VEAEDAQGLNRLSEEIRGRLVEMALIIARVSVSERSGSAVLKFVPREGVQLTKASGGFDYLEIVEIFPGFE
jgi:hypothetical protein